MAVRLGDPVEKSYGRADINDRYHRYDKILGRGAYKTVYWGWDTADGVDVAWNTIDLDALPSTEERSKISREVDMLRKLNHRHILRIRHNWENPHTKQLCFITDILQGGSLREYIRQRKIGLGRCKSWCRQILDALDYLHCSSPAIIHRDLKCDNIFIDGPSGNITIGDLGLSTQYASTNYLGHEKGMSIVGTPEFMAPELYEEQYDEKVDIYAFGMCVLEMVSKKYPYEECTNQIQVIRKVTDKKQPDILRKLHRYVRTFIELCIDNEPKKRPSAKELLAHPFLTYMDDLKNKLPASDFVFNEDRIVQSYKEMEQMEQQNTKQLTTIPEREGSNSPSPLNKTKRVKKKKKKYVTGTAVCIENGGNISVRLKIHHDKESQKVKFQYDPNTENISSVVREMVETLELDQTREYEIVNAIKTKLNTLDSTATAPTTAPSTQEITPQLVPGANPKASPPLLHHPHPTTPAPLQSSPHRYPQQQRSLSSQAPSNMTLTNTHNTSTNNPHSAKPSDSSPVGGQKNTAFAYTETNNVSVMPVTSILNHHNALAGKRKLDTSTQSISAPVTPGHSPPTEKNIMSKLRPIGGGYSSDNTEYHPSTSPVEHTNLPQHVAGTESIEMPQTNVIKAKPPKLVSDSLLDQIMALPRQTIKARIKQFGGNVDDDDETRILVTKLFQLLSENTKRSTSNTDDQTISTAASGSASMLNPHHNLNTGNISHTHNNLNAPAMTLGNLNPSYPSIPSIHTTAPSLAILNKASSTDNEDVIVQQSNSVLMHHNMGSVPHSGLTAHNNSLLNVDILGNLNPHKSAYNASSVPSTNAPPRINNIQSQPQLQLQRTNITNIVAMSPTNELVYQQRQISQESNKSVSHPTHSTHSQDSPRSNTIHQRAQNTSIIEIDDDDDGEIDPNIQLPKLRIRQKELMKNKICAEMERLKQRNDTQCGRDKTIKKNDIALELEGVEKQIKLLTDAAKCGAKIKKRKISKDYSYHSDKETDKKSVKKNANGNSNAAVTASRQLQLPGAVTSDTASFNLANKEEDGLGISTDFSVVASMSASNSVSVSFIETTEGFSPQGSGDIAHISSPLVSKTKRDEFEHYVQQLPERLDLLREIGSIQQQMSSLKNVSYNTWHTSESRIIREKKQLEEEYNQYYGDQTEMLLLKLQKHKHNAAKCISETQSTANKLKCKQDKQRNKFRSIVDDQLQILQLTQELNENEDAVGNVAASEDKSNIAGDEYYLYKESMDKVYLERVKQFELKQKKEFDAFRSDLHQLKQLRLETRKKSIALSNANNSTQGSSPPMTMNFAAEDMHGNTFSLQANGHNQQNQQSKLPVISSQLSLNSKPSMQLHSKQMDILTGLQMGDELMESNFIHINRGLHYHSSSMPLIESPAHSHSHSHSLNSNMHPGHSGTGSKFKVSAVGGNYKAYPHPLAVHQHHSQSSTNIAALTPNSFDLNNNSFDANSKKSK